MNTYLVKSIDGKKTMEFTLKATGISTLLNEFRSKFYTARLKKYPIIEVLGFENHGDIKEFNEYRRSIIR